MKNRFTVTIYAPDGKFTKSFSGLSAKAANKAIAYASYQLGRKICPDVTDAWLETRCLAVEAICDYGRRIVIYQHIPASTGPWVSPLLPEDDVAPSRATELMADFRKLGLPDDAFSEWKQSRESMEAEERSYSDRASRSGNDY